ncbi:hypothetical protein LH427_14235, partial [Laribacter hongkongensis]
MYRSAGWHGLWQDGCAWLAWFVAGWLCLAGVSVHAAQPALLQLTGTRDQLPMAGYMVVLRDPTRLLSVTEAASRLAA